MAYAITEGQQLDLSAFKRDPALPPKTQEQKEKTLESGIKAAKVYWQTRATNPRAFQQALAQIKLGLAFTLFGDRINPLYNALKSYLPLYRLEQGGPGLRDWDHLTDFLHHKLLLADERTLILGGRNVEDSYHMHSNPLLQRYRFMDTDLRVDLKRASPELGQTYQRLWNFGSMVATLDEVQTHAPNDFVAATAKADEVCGPLEANADAERSEDCRTEVFARYSDAETRIAEAEKSLRERAERYRRDYRPMPAPDRDPALPVDAQARLFYLENLPFTPNAPGQRSFGGQTGKEAESGKAIHAAWIAGLGNACAAAAPDRPQRVVLHNAYFMPPANLLAALGDMASGNWNCRDVELSVLTNSPGTTDLRIINFGARYPIKAVSDHVGAVGRTNRAARVRYFEYRPQGDIRGQSDLSLHSKVSVLGPDMIIGSANADVRSFMMDTNNGVFIGNAPALKQRYLDWLDEILQDRGRTMELTGQMRNLSLEQMLAEDRVVAKAFVERKLSGRFEEEPPLDPALDELERILTNIYGLSAKALGGGPGTAKARQRYDALLKLF
jgi:phosphatidylserine/phosphatidylglycerophosphate/cardiolipin synthase-like enzyme